MTAMQRVEPAGGYRGDLEGLRGVAILLVLLFHAGIPLATGGYVGVDVFFVLSGFLITGLLIAERERSGRINLRAFYARRARRILPASLFVLVATVAWSWLVVSPLDLVRFAQDAIASAVFAGNLRFAANALDYFSANTSPSPILHYWSLGVEEQFYLVWPALLIVATALVRPRLGAGIVLVLVFVGSLAAAIVLTDVAAPWAFYSLPSRAWQLALGGLLAVVTWRPRLPAWLEQRVDSEMDMVTGEGAVTDAAPDVMPEAMPDVMPEARPAIRHLLSPRAVAAAPAVDAPAFDLMADDAEIENPEPSPTAPTALGRAVVGASNVGIALVGWLGLGAIVAALFVIDPSTPYPGTAALLPTLGAGAVIFAGTHRWSPGFLLAAAPLRFLGRISFSLYLVHWPILVLPAIDLIPGDQLPIEERVGLAAASVAVAWVSYRIVEEPFRRGRRLVALPAGRTIALAGAAIALVVLVAGAASANATQILDAYGIVGAETANPIAPAASGEEAGDTGTPLPGVLEPASPEPSLVAAASTAPPSATAGATPRSSTKPRATTKPKPTPSPTKAPTPTQAPLGAHPAGPQPLSRNIQPPLGRAQNDWERIEQNGCTLQELGVQPPNCVFGDPKGAVTIALVGNSHAAQWFPAFEKIANSNGWRLLTFTKLACRFFDVPIYSRTLKREYTECETWRGLVVQRLQAVKPTLTVIASAEGLAPINQADSDPRRQGQGLARLIKQIPGQVAILADTLWWTFDPPSCISRHLNDVTACEIPRATALTWAHGIIEKTAASLTDATVVNMDDVICPYSPCPVVLNGMIVYRDSYHLTATFAASLAPVLEERLRPLLPKS